LFLDVDKLDDASKLLECCYCNNMYSKYTDLQVGAFAWLQAGNDRGPGPAPMGFFPGPGRGDLRNWPGGYRLLLMCKLFQQNLSFLHIFVVSNS